MVSAGSSAVLELVILELTVLDSKVVVVDDCAVVSEVDEVVCRLVSCAWSSSSCGSLDASTLLAQSVARTLPTLTCMQFCSGSGSLFSKYA